MPLKPARAALIPLFAAMALLAACDKPQESTEASAAAPQVGVVTVEAQHFVMTTELPGRTRAYRVAEVRPQVSGIIQKRLFRSEERRVGKECRTRRVTYYKKEIRYNANVVI